jgi:hypothetical protein
LLPELEATYDQLVARIAANIRSHSQVPEVGEVLPDFCMMESDRKLVELASLLDKGHEAQIQDRAEITRKGTPRVP